MDQEFASCGHVNTSSDEVDMVTQEMYACVCSVAIVTIIPCRDHHPPLQQQYNSGGKPSSPLPPKLHNDNSSGNVAAIVNKSITATIVEPRQVDGDNKKKTKKSKETQRKIKKRLAGT